MAITQMTHKDSRYYERYKSEFGPQRNDAITLLELGVKRGNSLKFLSEFFVQGNIIGIDKNLTECNIDDCDRVRVFQGLQQDTNFLENVASQCAPSGFDIIIDDASHIAKLTAISFWHLFQKHLKPGGVYIIEDWGTGYWSTWEDGEYYQNTNHTAGMVGFVKELIDEVGASAITHERHGQGPQRAAAIETIQFYSGLVFVTKAYEKDLSTLSQSEA